MAAGDEYYADLAKIEILYAGERNTAANVFFCICAGATGAGITALNTAAHDIFTAWGENIMPIVNTAVSLAEVKVSDWTSMDGLTGSYLGSQAGTYSGDPLTDQVATLINFLTTLRYRGGRGRMYLPAPSVTAMETGDQWTGDFITAANTAMTDVMSAVSDTPIGDVNLEWCLFHRGTDYVPKGTEALAGWSVSEMPATQRRRVRRAGHKR